MPSPPLALVQSLSPRIAVLTADDVIKTCEANGCAGLEELLRPWEGSAERVSILSSTLTPTIHPSFPLRFVSFSSIFPDPAASTPQPDVVVDQLSSLVTSRKPIESVLLATNCKTDRSKGEEQHYPLTRSLLLSSRALTSHETFNHPVGVVLAVSTQTPDPLGTLQRLLERSRGPMAQAVPWMDGVNLMRIFVVVHDVSQGGEDLGPANELLANVKRAHGPHSILLVTNSQTSVQSDLAPPDTAKHPSIPLPRPLTPVDSPSALSQVYASALSSLTLSPINATSSAMTQTSSNGPRSPAKSKKRYGQHLNAEDTQRLASLVREVVVQSLVPWMEARVREWNEIYHANRRGITGRLFGAGRKLFSSRPSTPAPNGMQAGFNSVKGYYPTSAIETLSRRLADFAFMLRDYKYAATVYDSLRRDFAQDRAWRYAAAATEMYGLSLLLSHTYFSPTTPPTPPAVTFTTLQHTDISSWLEQAVVAYQSRTPPNQIQLDAMRATVLYYEAWRAIGEWRGVGAALVRAAGEADEVPSAVMIEEAASADVKGGTSKRGRRRQAFDLVMAARRYETAGLKTYSRRCLDRASQIYRDAPWTVAQDWVEYSLGRQAYTIGESDVAVEHFLRLLRRDELALPGSQGMVLEDMSLAYDQLKARPDLMEKSKSQLELLSPVFDTTATRICTSSSAQEAGGSKERWAEIEAKALATWDRKGKKPMRLLPETQRIVVGVGERCTVELLASNPLNAPLALAEVSVEFDNMDAVQVEALAEVVLEPYESRLISIPLTVTKPATLSCQTVHFRFHRFFPCSQSLEKRGARLHTTKAQRLTPTYAKDASLSVTVEASRPSLKVELVDLPWEVYAGEEIEAAVRLTNVGTAAVNDVQLFVGDRGTIRQRKPDTRPIASNVIPPHRALTLLDEAMAPDETRTIPITFSSSAIGTSDVLGLVIYSSAEDPDLIAATKLAQAVGVRPLLALHASARPAQAGPDTYLLGVTCSNLSPMTVRLHSVEFQGAYWSANPASPADVSLLPNQSWRTFASIARSEAATAPDQLWQRELVTALGKLVDNRDDNAPVTPINLPADLSLNSEIRAAQRLAYLQACFPTIPLDRLSTIFPLIDPLNLDISVSWSLVSDGGHERRGRTLLHGARLTPAFSIVEDLRRQVDLAIAQGGKQTRTMYEETGRLRRILMDSVLEGVLAREDDPVVVRVTAVGGEQGKVLADPDGLGPLPVRFELQNRSPAVAVRFVLRLSTGMDDHDMPQRARFTGQLVHRGTIPALRQHEINVLAEVGEWGAVELERWQLEVETGVEADGAWTQRRTWTRVGAGPMLEVSQKQ